MASIKLSLAKTKKNDGTQPLYYILSHGNRTARIATNISVAADQWDKKKLQVTNHPQKKQLNLMLTQRKFDIEQTLYNIASSRSVRSLTATQLKDLVVAKINGEDESINVRSLFEKIVSLKERRNTIMLYRQTMVNMEKYDPAILDGRLENIDYDWLMSFERWLNCATNTKAAYFTRLRALFNYAINAGYTTAYPFRTFKIKTAQTRKRNLSIDKLRSFIFNTEHPPKRQVFVDFFSLQFLLIGINIIDFIENIAIVNGRVEYIRAKTGRAYSIKVEQEMMPLLERFYTNDELNLKEYGVRRFTQRYNFALKDMENITSYWSRHSWATIAASLDIPKDVIAAALGHGGNTVTDIYIDFDRKKIDEANRKVIDYVWYNKL